MGNLQKIIFALVIALIVVSYLEARSASVTTCLDTDTGKSYDKKGTITITEPSGLSKSYTDFCSSPTELQEYICNVGPDYQTVDNAYTLSNYRCSYDCRDGACVTSGPLSPTVTCTDDDTASDVYLKGTVTLKDSNGNSKAYEDTCIDQNTLRQYGCRDEIQSLDNGYVYSTQSCQYGCSNGACKKQFSTPMPTPTPQPTPYPLIQSLTITPSLIDITTTLAIHPTLSDPKAMGLCGAVVNNVSLDPSYYSGDYTKSCYPAIIKLPDPSLGITAPGSYPVEWTFIPEGCKSSSCRSDKVATLIVTGSSSSSSSGAPPKCYLYGNLAFRTDLSEGDIYSKDSEVSSESYSSSDDDYLNPYEEFNSALINLEDAKTEIQNVRYIGAVLSRRINSIIEFLSSSLEETESEVCEENILSAIDRIDGLISVIEKRICKSNRLLKRQKCVPLDVADKTIPILENAQDKLDSSLAFDNDEDLVADICAIQEIDDVESKSHLAKPVPGRFVVRFKDSKISAQEIANALQEKYGLEIIHLYENVFKGANVIVPSGIEKELLLDPLVEKLSQDYETKVEIISSSDSKPLEGESVARSRVQIANPSSPQEVPVGVNFIDAGLNTNEGDIGCKVTVAVLDTGIDLDHPDLKANLNLSLAKDFKKTGTVDDFGGHGTLVAGVIGAIDNSSDVIGVGSKIEIVPIKILDSGGYGTEGDLIAALDYINDKKSMIYEQIDVINLSLRWTHGRYLGQVDIGIINDLHDAVKATVKNGVTIVAAAGNEGEDINLENVVPAIFPEVITVSALYDTDGIQGTYDDSWALFSNWASNYGREVDIIAPTVVNATQTGGGITTFSGTSAATPHVAGTFALYISKNGRPVNADASKIRHLINLISRPRLPLTNEPDESINDGYMEPVLYANGPALR